MSIEDIKRRAKKREYEWREATIGDAASNTLAVVFLFEEMQKMRAEFNENAEKQNALLERIAQALEDIAHPQSPKGKSMDPRIGGRHG